MAKIYWRRIKAGTRFYEDVPTAALQEEIKALAIADVENGVITVGRYEELIGEAYPEDEAEAEAEAE